MSRRASPSISRAYGILRVVRLWGISRATLYRHRRCDQPSVRPTAWSGRTDAGRGCVERFIRTLKENLLWVRRFATIEGLRLALLEFQRTYNQTWIVERHGYQTPAAVRAAQLAPLSAVA